MRNRPVRFLQAITFAAALMVGASAVAQPPDPNAREELVTKIKGYADRHAASGPMQTALVVDLFRNDPAGLLPPDIALIYEEEYAARKAATKAGPWDDYTPNGWALVAVVAIFVAAFRDWIKALLSKVLAWLSVFLYERFAGSRAFRRIALSTYRKRLRDKYSEIHIPFRPGRPLRMSDVYVPLKVADAGGEAPRDNRREEIDALDALSSHRRLVMVGAPGSGKSMLFKHIAVAYAEGGLRPLVGAPIPVLIELHRLNDTKTTIEAQIVAELGRCGFPHAETFVDVNLEQGRLLLLLDGLDEVPSSERTGVCQLIKDLAGKHSSTRLVVTCRRAVYRGELDEITDQKVELVDFNDQQIQRFLQTWAPGMPPEKSVDQLVKALADRPKIKTLARNPLQLTIIAYLYTDTKLVLPHSRSEFYRKSTDALLDNWHIEHNTFPSAVKRVILEHLALYIQESADPNDRDRKTLDFQVAQRETRTLCPSLNVKADDAGKILDEIVERSGLLLSLDGKQRYGFAHLTLQEFFAASRLASDPDHLLKLFGADHDAWRETVKLWCGLSVDSTKVIQAVQEIEPVMAFECLADAQKVDAALSEAIIADFEKRLGERGADADAIQAAFGAVAADPRPRGATVFQMLLDSLESEELRGAAAHALAQTNLPEAATRLARRTYGSWDREGEARSALLKMGDLAVPAIEGHCSDFTMRFAIQDLRRIGTPRAARAIVPGLWMDDRRVAEASALALASLFQAPGVEATLGETRLSPDCRTPVGFDWVWKPFAEPEGSSLPTIAARVVAVIMHVINDAKFDTDALGPGDPRLMIPVCLVKLPNDISSDDREKMVKAAHKFSARVQGTRAMRTVPLLTKEDHLLVDPKHEYELVAAVLASAGASTRFRNLVEALPPPTQFDFVCRLLRKRLPTTDDWVNLFRPIKYEFETGWHLRAFLLLWAATAALPIVHLVNVLRSSTNVVDWTNALHIGACLLVIAGASLYVFVAVSNWRDPTGETWKWSLFFGPPVAPLALVASVIYTVWRPLGKIESSWGILFFLPPNLCVVSLFYFGTKALPPDLPWIYIVLFWSVPTLISVLLWLLGWRRDAAARNPLHGILDRVSPSRQPEPAPR